MPINWPSKRSSDTEDYDVDWSKRLSVGDSITGSSWTISATSLVLGSSSFTATLTKVFVSGGTPNQIYTITNTITTALGDTLSEDMLLPVRDD